MARAAISKELGPERLATLHRQIPVLDLAAVFGSIVAFALLAWQLAVRELADPLWWIALFVQGNLVVVMSIINHDVFVHRKFLPVPVRWVVSSILVAPAMLRGSLYESRHLTHHRALGTKDDTETLNLGINTVFRRAVYATPALLVFRALFYRGLVVASNDKPAFGGVRRAVWERNTRYSLIVLALASLAFNWQLLIVGYLLPLLVIGPLVNTMRIVLEHFDLEPRNPFWVGTFYRCGPLTKLMYWWGAGDCHIVHHFYPTVPFYRMNAALRLIVPILRREGVYEHRSLLPLLRDWFMASRGHWSVPAEVSSMPPKSS